MKIIDKNGSHFDKGPDIRTAVPWEIKYIRMFRGILSVVSRDPPGKEGNARFKPVP